MSSSDVRVDLVARLSASELSHSSLSVTSLESSVLGVPCLDHLSPARALSDLDLPSAEFALPSAEVALLSKEVAVPRADTVLPSVETTLPSVARALHSASAASPSLAVALPPTELILHWVEVAPSSPVSALPSPLAVPPSPSLAHFAGENVRLPDEGRLPSVDVVLRSPAKLPPFAEDELPSVNEAPPPGERALLSAGVALASRVALPTSAPAAGVASAAATRSFAVVALPSAEPARLSAVNLHVAPCLPERSAQ
mmetsp:Transcript_12614/g.39410  ORF Transcript_12614/g.39410 Transcript_12614/m.39410 type:complete len:255 (-) Transcript_12614:124-888(-)